MVHTLSMISPAASFSAYVTWAQQQPNLTEDEEKGLFVGYQQHNNLEAVKKLLLSHLKYVIKIAGNYSGYGLAVQDLIQEGTVGLMKAVKRFDISHAVRFSTFAVYWIKSEIHEYIIRNWRMVKIATTKAQRKLFFRLRKQLNYEVRSQDNLQQIAFDAGVSIEDTKEMHIRMLGSEDSLESKIPHQEGETVLGEVLSLPGDNPLDLVCNAQARDMRSIYIKNAIDALNEREQWIIKQRWMLENDADKSTLENMSKHLGISVERVRQLESQAIKRMKQYLESRQMSLLDLSPVQAAAGS